MAPTQAKLTAALKNEIGIMTDEAALVKQIEENQVRIEDAINKILAHFAPPESEKIGQPESVSRSDENLGD